MGESMLARLLVPGWDHEGHRDARADDQQAAYAEAVPLGRLGRVHEISAAVTFLASEDAGYITGAVLPVDGGLFMG